MRVHLEWFSSVMGSFHDNFIDMIEGLKLLKPMQKLYIEVTFYAQTPTVFDVVWVSLMSAVVQRKTTDVLASVCRHVFQNIP